MSKIRFFQQSELSTQCDVCGGRVDLIHGGICESCRRILCYRHLYGSWLARLKTDLGGRTLCVDCRAGRVPERAEDAPGGG
jgi:hypothetical protein